ncbi:hypothetical protein V5N11_035972 [Cardamine amara subsp. amara]|uniref:Endoplasmic reticulum transmembrane protein n=1 Tax=Cardamine amara subsp. amara TaxID=228776 RepID=A0ABD0Z4R4_CARAN
MFVEMFQLLFTVVLIEAGLILALGFGTPVRRVVVKLIDLLKQGRGPLVLKTVAATIIILFGSVMYSTIQINTRVSESGGVANSTDQVMFANRLLEAFLMGTILFMAMVIDRMHYYTRELQIIRRNLEIAVKKSKTDA